MQVKIDYSTIGNFFPSSFFFSQCSSNADSNQMVGNKSTKKRAKESYIGPHSQIGH